MQASKLALSALVLILSACASGKPVLFVEEGASLASYRTVYVSEMKIVTGKPADAEVARAIEDRIRAKLADHGVALATGADADATVVLESRLTNYAAGSALARWVAPGLGTTECLVEGELLDGRTRSKLGVVLSYRTVSSGGLYSAGAGTWILDVVAEDIADALAAQMKGTP